MAMAMKRALPFELPHCKRVRIGSRVLETARSKAKRAAPGVDDGVHLRKRAKTGQLNPNKRVRVAEAEDCSQKNDGVHLRKRAKTGQVNPNKRVRIAEAEDWSQKKLKPAVLPKDPNKRDRTENEGSSSGSSFPKKLRPSRRREEVDEGAEVFGTKGGSKESDRTYQVVPLDSEDKQFCSQFSNMSIGSSSSYTLPAEVEFLDFEYNKVVRSYGDTMVDESWDPRKDYVALNGEVDPVCRVYNDGYGVSKFQVDPKKSYVCFSGMHPVRVWDIRSKRIEQV